MKARPFRTPPPGNPSEVHFRRMRREGGRAGGSEWIGDAARNRDECGEEMRRGPSRGAEHTAEFVLIQVCESDRAALPARERSAYYECLVRHVAIARQIGIAPILVPPLRMRVYTPAGQQRREVFSCVAAMQEVAADMNVPFVDLQTGSGALFRLVARELSRQLDNNPNCFIYYSEPGIKRSLSWWYVRENDRWRDHARMARTANSAGLIFNRE